MKDSYQTIATPGTGEFRDRGSKFIAYAFPAETEEEALAHLEKVKSEHFKARHHCYAYRLGLEGHLFRANDDGEPSSTAGRPVLGQIDRLKLTNVMVIVVRYFGGIKLGTSGLIQAYKTSAAAALENTRIVKRIVESRYSIRFEYSRMGDVMSAIERCGVTMIDQHFEEKAEVLISLRKGEAEQRLTELKAHMDGVSREEAENLKEMKDIRIDLLED